MDNLKEHYGELASLLKAHRLIREKKRNSIKIGVLGLTG